MSNLTIVNYGVYAIHLYTIYIRYISMDPNKIFIQYMIDKYEIVHKTIKKFGTGSHILVDKKHVGKKAIVLIRRYKH